MLQKKRFSTGSPKKSDILFARLEIKPFLPDSTSYKVLTGILEPFETSLIVKPFDSRNSLKIVKCLTPYIQFISL